MRPLQASTVLLILISVALAQNSWGTEGGNISSIDLNGTGPGHWAGIVGWPNGVLITDATLPLSERNATNDTIYTNRPNGTYAELFNTSMVITRMPTRPNLSSIQSVTDPNDFNETGIFSNFTAFATMANYSNYIDSPPNTFSPWSLMACELYNTPFICPYITLNPSTRMAVLKYVNGSIIEPLFVEIVMNRSGYNDTDFDFQYMVPILEQYYFYTYNQKECNITVWIDDVQTNTFPKTGVPYKVEVLVRDANLAIVPNARLRAVEENGRSIFYPIIEASKKLFGFGEMQTNSSGRALFALEPTRYNIPDSYDYQVYIEVDDSFYCRQNLSIASYGSLSPTYRTSLVNPAYGSQVKASVQNMNALASTASKWVTARKMREKNVTMLSNGTIVNDSTLPLKAGAPNRLNITILDSGTLLPINATLEFHEKNGLVVFSPLQPDKDLYDSRKIFYSNETMMLIPTGYNNNANFTVLVSNNGTPLGEIQFIVDPTVDVPQSSEADMDDQIYAAISASMQNINSVLVNIAKSLSTV
ncbi:MAG: hypothetical protein V1492_02940 [Candidatus Micrarchaeota archaeon]